MKSLRRKFVVSLIAILFAVVALGTVTYAYWAGVINAPLAVEADSSVTIGKGGTVDTLLTIADVGVGGTLVPVGQEVPGTSVNNENKTFTINWTGDGATGAIGELSAEVTTLSLGGLTDSEINAMFTINVTLKPEIIAGTSLDYIVNVEFTNEPTDMIMYNKIVNKTLVIGITFTVTPAPIVTP